MNNRLNKVLSAGLSFGRSAPSGNAEEREALLLMRDYERSGLGWFWSTDANGLITYISPGVCERLGASAQSLVGTRFDALFAQDRQPGEDNARTLPLTMRSAKSFSELAVRPAAPGREVWWALTGRPQFDESRTFTGYRGNAVDATERLRTQRDASRLAMFDSLTGLSNRHRIGQFLERTLRNLSAVQPNCAIMMIDLDRFKQVNDTLGHPAGDELLKQVAQRIRPICGQGAELGRLGGDEFQVVLPGVDDRGKLGETARQIIAAISQPYTIDGSRCVIGASIGIAIAPSDGASSEDLIRSADLALYAAKGSGRGRFRFYSADLHTSAEKRRRLEEDLRDALVQGQISLNFQPLVATGTDTVVGVEALMRWQHPEFGSVSPSVFIPIAEESNLIVALGDWALRQACIAVNSWPGEIRVAVNVSPVQFAHDHFLASVANALAQSGISPDRLEIELTESIFVNNDEATDRTFTALKRLGVRLALDDFGTGYSSLGYLKQAPFDKIKIDKGFIRDVTVPGSRNPAIITAIVSLAKALDMVTTAEGIEARDELDLMRELGVDQIQGYIYSSALSAGEVSEALSSGGWVIDPMGPARQRAERRTVLRKISVIHEDHRYEVTMRNLSRTGMAIEGLSHVPIGTEFVVDFGDGQFVVARVRRAEEFSQGLEFEVPLVDDGSGGLCTRYRISAGMMATVGLSGDPSQQAAIMAVKNASVLSLPKFATTDGRKGSRAA